MFYVPSPFRGILDGRIGIGRFENHPRQTVDRYAMSVPNIINSHESRVDRKIDVGGDDIFDIDKIPRLLPVAKDGNRFLAQSSLREDRNRSRVLALGVMWRAWNIEIPQTGCRKTPFIGEHGAVVFPIELGNRVGTFGLG